MERRKNFYELTQSLSSGLFADKVMMLLCRIKNTKALRPDDEKTLNHVEQFFNDVLAGYRWSDEPHFSDQSLKFANSFSQAVHAVIFSPQATTFESYMKQLLSIAKDIKSNNFQDDKIEELNNFFYKFSKSQLQRTDTILNKTSVSFP